MYYYSYELYMSWYNWYYGINTVSEEPVVINGKATEPEKTPHDFPSCNFTQATLNEAIIASINDPPPPPQVPMAKAVHFEIKKIDTKKKKKKGRKYY